MKLNRLYRMLPLALALLLTACGGVLTRPTPTPTAAEPEGPIARVRDEYISVSEYQTAVRYARYQMVSQHSQLTELLNVTTDSNARAYFESQQLTLEQQLADPEFLGGLVIEYLLNDRLIRQEARLRGISVSLEETEARVQAMFGYYPNATPQPPIAGPTPTPFTGQEYAAQLVEFLDELKTRADISREDFFLFMESQIYLDKLTAQIGADVAVSAEQVHARHILVADEAAARAVLARLEAGETWEDLAAQLSTDAANAQTGGDLGWFQRGQMVAEFEEACFTLEVGATSEPVETQFGWHLIQVLERGDHPLPADEIEQARREKMQIWLSSQLDGVDANGQFNVEVYDGWERLTPTVPAIR